MSLSTLDRPSEQSAPEWGAVATEEQIASTVSALRERGFDVEVVDDADAARAAVLALIPDGAEVHQASSTTLDQIGVTDAINTSGSYQPVRPRIFAMDRATQGAEIRQLMSAPAYMLGSVHAITQDGSLVTASKSGSQLGPYASGAGKLILVAGTNKIVSDLDEAFRRIDQHSLPLEDARARIAYGFGSSVHKLLVLNAERTPGPHHGHPDPGVARLLILFTNENGVSLQGHPVFDSGRARSRSVAPSVSARSPSSTRSRARQTCRQRSTRYRRRLIQGLVRCESGLASAAGFQRRERRPRR